MSMVRTVLMPAVLFVVGALLTVMSLYAAWALLAVGLGLCVYSFVQTRRLAERTTGLQSRGPLMASLSMRAGVALVAAPVITVLLVMAAMSGFLGGH
jgi:hypothetical protein